LITRSIRKENLKKNFVEEIKNGDKENICTLLKNLSGYGKRNPIENSD